MPPENSGQASGALTKLRYTQGVDTGPFTSVLGKVVKQGDIVGFTVLDYGMTVVLVRPMRKGARTVACFGQDATAEPQ